MARLAEAVHHGHGKNVLYDMGRRIGNAGVTKGYGATLRAQQQSKTKTSDRC
jgi:hypothetical protein